MTKPSDGRRWACFIELDSPYMVPQQIGVLPIMTQQVQPALRQAIMQSQQP